MRPLRRVLQWSSRETVACLPLAIGVISFDEMVLPVRIELTTSPFIALALSRPPPTTFVRWTIPSP